ncbi:HAD family hydrolase [Piscinibacter sp.]|uniref:HAD family hydrolase n=1 Tax=Piscinibacter sp. TaxID=1903157 RepID=UPI002C77BA41|nr:HAD-IA family hydrolase [Albitalea sp.]HUG26488.1 HAD-IA family hydrolase [Albitalea sp.]
MKLAPIRALTLDLDDTLWPIAPAILRAEAALHGWLVDNAPATAAAFDIVALRKLRDEVGRAEPQWAHDLTRVRLESLRVALRRAGDDEALADAAFEVFFAARHEVELYPEVLAALQRLSAAYPLFALSNGNADIARVGLGPWFRGALSAREFGIGKPDPRIFIEACRRLGCEAGEVLHVGDDLELDVLGAQSAGLQTLWLRREDCAALPRDGVATVACLRSLADTLGC